MPVRALSSKDLKDLLPAPQVQAEVIGEPTVEANQNRVPREQQPSHDNSSYITSETPGVNATDINLDSPPEGGYVKFNFEDSAELACLLDESLLSGRVTLHRWQVEDNIMLSQARPTSLLPFKYCLCAANGSGKDKFVIAPFAIWFAVSKIRSLCVITSASGAQLTAQTEGYLRTYAERFNAKFPGSFKINQRFIRCIPTGSEIRLFATDEAGRAEGYHPLETDSEFVLIVNEGKNVTEEIHEALSRCTGYNYWLEVSTPGEPHGFFHYAFTHWEHTRHVSAYDCPHISRSEIEDDRIHFGESSSIFRSKILALFTTIGGQVVILADTLTKCFNNSPGIRHTSWPKRVGMDYAAGGDENVLIITQGNAIIAEEYFIMLDPIASSRLFDKLLLKYGIDKTSEFIFGDDGGVGRGQTFSLIDMGWNVKRILNQSPAILKTQFGNRGAENWFRCARLFQENLMHTTNFSKKLREQLAMRYYSQQQTLGRITLESKKDARAHGHPSPDRADAYILSLTGLTVENFIDAERAGNTSAEDNTDTIIVTDFRRPASSTRKHGRMLGSSPADIAESWDRLDYEAHTKSLVTKQRPTRHHGSISVLLSKLVSGKK